MPLTLNIKNLDKVLAEVKAYPQDIDKIINNEFKAFGLNVSNDAKRFAPVNEGRLKQSISSEVTDLKVSIAANVDYAAYIEFGTKGFAARYVATLPPDWQTLAAGYKGPGGGGNFEAFVMKIYEWVRLKGIGATYNIKTRRRDRIGKQTAKQTMEADAYAIALYIIRHGIRQHPFLFPAFEKNKIELINNLKKQLNAK